MRILFLIVLFGLTCFISKGQSKLILQKGLKRTSIKEGQLLGITKVGENYKFNDWKNLCKCDEGVRQNFWVVDSIASTAIGLVNFGYKVSFKIDTVLGSKRTRKMKSYMFQKRIISESGNEKLDKFVYKVPTIEVFVDKRKTIRYDSIESFTFSRADINKCGRMNLLDFDFTWTKDLQFSRKGGMVAIVLALAILSGVIIEAAVDSTILVVEEKGTIKQKLRRYKLSEWKIKIK